MNNFNLDKEPKLSSGFITPDNYFDDFQNKITPKLNKKPQIFYLKKNWIMAAAAIILITLSISLINKLSTASSTIDSVSLENYIATHTTVSEDDLVNLLNEKDIETLNITNNIGDKVIEETLLQNTNLEQYIIN